MQKELPLNAKVEMVIDTDKPYKIYAESAEHTALKQFESAMQQSFAVKGALMPDVHSGYTLPIGAVVATKGVIVPSWIGFDIGCGVLAVKTTAKKEWVEQHTNNIFDEVYKAVPTGFSNNARPCKASMLDVKDLSPYGREAFERRGGWNALGSLGGGNHFIEIGYDENEDVWITVHSGSRGPGHGIATEFMRLASPTGKASEGHYGFSTESALGKDYINDMGWALQFALDNREEIMHRVLFVLTMFIPGCHSVGQPINRNHNHAEQKGKLWIHRKGATHADQGMLGVVPGNMRDGVFITEGKGNPDSLWSSSHGAGRVMGRGEAKEKLTMEDFRVSMKGIKAKVELSTLDESYGAYKNIFDVMRQQEELVEVLHYVRPIINIKG